MSAETIENFGAEYVGGVADLFARLPDGDLTFIKENVSPASIAGWVDAPGWRWVDVAADGTVLGIAALLPLTGWSDHVAELRLVVDPATRGRGVGRALTQHAVLHGLRSGILKVVVEVPAVHERIASMFIDLGFTGEALLRDQIRTRNGDLEDLLMLALLVDQSFDANDASGLGDLVDGH